MTRDENGSMAAVSGLTSRRPPSRAGSADPGFLSTGPSATTVIGALPGSVLPGWLRHGGAEIRSIQFP